jgi:hypothetical protein
MYIIYYYNILIQIYYILYINFCLIQAQLEAYLYIYVCVCVRVCVYTPMQHSYKRVIWSFLESRSWEVVESKLK